VVTRPKGGRQARHVQQAMSVQPVQLDEAGKPAVGDVLLAPALLEQVHQVENSTDRHHRLQPMRAHALGDRRQAVTRIPRVLREWREPRHPEFREGRTAWRLFNAFTESLKGGLDALPGRTQALHGLLDGACGLAVSRN
jgi:hypothetical protein